MLKLGPAMSPSGNTRPQEHDANPKPRFVSSGPLRASAGKRKNPLQLRPKMPKIPTVPIRR